MALYNDKTLIEAGVDEVARGCLAGPVVSAAVILKKGIKIKNLKDSKKLNFKQRIEIVKNIKKNSFFSIGLASVKEIEKLNILQASLLSMKRAIINLSKKPDLVLVDGNFAPQVDSRCKTIVKGDEKFQNIAAASILAKTYRDELMDSLDKNFPNYYWKKNKGYATKKHRESIKNHGITIHHRKSFKLFNRQTKLNLFIPLITFN